MRSDEDSRGRDEMNLALRAFEARRPGVFAALRRAGWDEHRRVDRALVAREPYWTLDFPQHPLATGVLERLGGLVCFGERGSSVSFGCHDAGTASSLKVVRPYEVERLLLLEESSGARPPAFPIATMGEWMLFLREDWKTITVGYNWRDALVTDDPFEIIEDHLTGRHLVWRDPTRHITIDDLDRVPASFIGGVFES